MSISSDLARAVESSGVSLYRISVDAGVAYATVHRFAHGERRINIETADKLAAYFGMKLTKAKRVK